MEITLEQLLELLKMGFGSATPPAKPAIPATSDDPLGPDKIGPDGMAVPPAARGNPPGIGYEWRRAQTPGGAWTEGWLYVGVQHGAGAYPNPGESPMQFAQRKGVPDTILATMTSFDAVYAYLNQPPPKAVGG
jgi:hypothetical protein